MPTWIYYRTIKYVNSVLCLLGTDCKKTFLWNNDPYCTYRINLYFYRKQPRLTNLDNISTEPAIVSKKY